MGQNNNNKNRAFLVNTENLDPIVLKHLENKGDILTLRTLQGEMAELYRLLSIQTNGTIDNFVLQVELEPNKTKIIVDNVHPSTIKTKVIRDVFLKHITNALEDLKNISLECILEDIKEVPVDGSVEELTAAKKTLEDVSRKNGSAKKEKLSS